MAAYIINICTFGLICGLIAVLIIGSSRGLWHKGFVVGLEACRVKSSR